MRRSGHIRERSPGHFELRYQHAGKTRTVTFRGGKKAAAEELRRLLRMVDTGDHAAAPNKMTTGAWLDKWLASVRETLAPQSHDRYSEIVALHLKPGLGDIPLAKLSETHIGDFYAALTRKDGRGAMSPRTRQLVHRVLSAALTRAVEDRMVVRNPADIFRRRLPKIEKREMLVLDADQSRRLIEAAKDTPLYAPILLALATGARRCECLGLRWKNVDLDKGIALISEALEHRRGMPIRSKAPKSGKSRSIALPGFAVAALRDLKRRQAEDLFRLGVRQTGDTLVCCQADGEVPPPDRVTNGFGRLIGRLPGMPAIHFHSLRHSHATALLAAGISPKVAQERLGHANIALTLGLYSHATPDMDRDAADKLNEAFK